MASGEFSRLLNFFPLFTWTWATPLGVRTDVLGGFWDELRDLSAPIPKPVTRWENSARRACNGNGGVEFVLHVALIK